MEQKAYTNNRANSMGDGLESYVKDAFCNSFHGSGEEKNRLYSQVFSYLGNSNNPPDIILRNSDAVEVKKIESINADLALNSSYPKSKIYSDSEMITKACRDCEEYYWEVKDIIYCIGYVGNNSVKRLCFIYGKDYAADNEVYERTQLTIRDGIAQIPGVHFSKTRELGRVNRVDPLGITYLRLRGMWHIKNPFVVFRDYYEFDSKSDFSLLAIIDNDKYYSFPEKDRIFLESIEDIQVKSIDIPDPNNPAKLIAAKLITFTK